MSRRYCSPYWADDEDDLMQSLDDAEEEEEEELGYTEKGELHINLLNSEAREVFDGNTASPESADSSNKTEVQQGLTGAAAAEARGRDDIASAVQDVKAVAQKKEDEWMPKNLHDPKELDEYMDYLVQVRGHVPPPSRNEHACWHLGDFDFAHVYVPERGEEDQSVKIEIRQWAFGLDEEFEREGLCITGRGLTLNWNQWQRLLDRAKTIHFKIFQLQNERYVDERYELGGDKFVSITSPFEVCNLRIWYQRDGDGALLPSKRGIALKFKQFKRLLKLESLLLIIKDAFDDVLKEEGGGGAKAEVMAEKSDEEKKAELEAARDTARRLFQQFEKSAPPKSRLLVKRQQKEEETAKASSTTDDSEAAKKKKPQQKKAPKRARRN